MFKFFKYTIKELEDLKLLHKGKSALIFGNGPSLDSINFDLLKERKDIVTFATNRIATLCKEKNSEINR